MKAFTLPKVETNKSQYSFNCSVTVKKNVMCTDDFKKLVKKAKKATAFLDSVVGRTMFFNFYYYVPENDNEIEEAKELNKNFGLAFLERVKFESKTWLELKQK